MNSLLLDLTTALRFFARRSAAFAVIVLTMALALGANTAVFSVLKAFLFAQLGIPEPERVALVWTTRDLPGRGRVDFSDAYPNYKLLQSSSRSFEAIGTTLLADVNWEQTHTTRRLQGTRATASFFNVVQTRAALGRLFNASEEGPRAASVAVISHSLWHRAFAGAANVIGHSLRLNGTPHTIIGVLPAGFAQPTGTDVWLPFDLPGNMWTAISGGRQLSTYARLAPGITFKRPMLNCAALRRARLRWIRRTRTGAGARSRCGKSCCRGPATPFSSCKPAQPCCSCSRSAIWRRS